jgi:hypothetical protein
MPCLRERSDWLRHLNLSPEVIWLMVLMYVVELAEW